MRIISITFVLLFFFNIVNSFACSVLYYVDKNTGKIYVVNNEDYWYDVNAYIQIEPKKKNKLARLWYGWKDFAQGGINSKGLFFDAAVTPKQKRKKGFNGPKGNLGDRILAQCATVEEALDFIEKEKMALDDSHMMFGDKTGNAVIVEWIDGKRKLHWISNNKLIMTNYLISKPDAGNFPCYRFNSIEERINQLESTGEEINLLKIGNTVGQAVQPPREDEKGKVGGTLYTSFIDISDMAFVLSFKLSNQKVIKLDLNEEFQKKKKRTINLNKL